MRLGIASLDPSYALQLTPGRHTPRMRGIQYAAASRLNHRRLWNTVSPAFAGDDDHGRHCERSEAIHRRREKESWIASSQVLLAMTQDTHPHSRGTMCPSFCMKLIRPENKRAQGRPGAQLAPAARVHW
jgi:hypothetical protein